MRKTSMLRKFFLSVLNILLICFVSLGVVEASQENEGIVTDTEKVLVMANVKQYVNMRQEPDRNTKRVGYLYKDCGGYILEKNVAWTKIQSGEAVGWVRNDFLLFGEEAKELAEKVGILMAESKADNLRVRAEADAEAKIIGHLEKNETVEVVSQTDDWVEVSYEGTSGYVSSQYVNVEFKIDTAETPEQKEEREKAEELAKRMVQIENIKANAAEVDILAALIQCEAGGEPYEGKVAVGAVVMNRVSCPAYPDTITSVIYASKQFSPATSGKMTNLILTGNIMESCRQAAIEAMNGVSPIGVALNFRRVGKNEGQIIGNHVFW